MKSIKKKDRSPGANEKNKSDDKNVQVSAVAAAAGDDAALHIDVDEVKESDHGGGYSNQSSDTYEGIVAPDSPPTPPPEAKKQKAQRIWLVKK